MAYEAETGASRGVVPLLEFRAARERYDILGINGVAWGPGDDLQAFKNRQVLKGVGPSWPAHRNGKIVAEGSRAIREPPRFQGSGQFRHAAPLFTQAEAEETPRQDGPGRSKEVG